MWKGGGGDGTVVECLSTMPQCCTQTLPLHYISTLLHDYHQLDSEGNRGGGGGGGGGGGVVVTAPLLSVSAQCPATQALPLYYSTLLHGHHQTDSQGKRIVLFCFLLVGGGGGGGGGGGSGGGDRERRLKCRFLMPVGGTKRSTCVE